MNERWRAGGHFDSTSEHIDAADDQAIRALGVDSHHIASGLEYYHGNERLVRDLARIAYRLRDRWHTYGRIVCDDASGRIPSIIYSCFLEAAKRTDVSSYRADFHPNWISVAGGHGSSGRAAEIRDTIEEATQSLPRGVPVLIVTEHINSGVGLAPLCASLETLKRPYDIASISVSRAVVEGRSHLGAARLLNLTYGELVDSYSLGNELRSIGLYNDRHAVGVTKAPGQTQPSAVPRLPTLSADVQLTELAAMEHAHDDALRIAQALLPLIQSQTMESV